MQTDTDTDWIEKTVESVKRLTEYLKQRAAEEKAKGLIEEAEKTLRTVAFQQKWLAQVYAENPWLEGEGLVDPKRSLTTSQPPASTTQHPVAQAIVLSAFIIAGAALLCVVLVTAANWYYAEMLFALVAYLIWQHYL